MSQKQKSPIQLILLLSLISWVCAFYALWHQTSLLSGAATESAFCNINSYVSCDAIALSPYAMLFGFPLAAFAMAFFASLFIFCTLLYFAELDRQLDQVKKLAEWVFWMAVGGLPVTFYYAVVSLFVIKNLCLSCMSIYLVHTTIAIVAYKIKQNANRHQESKAAAFSFSSATLMVLAAVIGLNLLAPKFLSTAMQSGPKIEESTLSLYVAQHLGYPKHEFKTDNAAVAGSEAALVTIVTFSDYQCPYCKLAANVIPSITRSYGDKVRLVYKDYPLSSECNPGMTHAGHPFACQAAKVAKCALNTFGMDGYQKLSKSLYAKQETLGTDTIKSLALEAGLSDSQISDCLSNLTIHEAIVSDVNEGIAARVESTPSVFVNGRKLDSAINPQILRMTIDHYLKR